MSAGVASLLYVSRKTDVAQTDSAIDEIVEVARVRNARLGITGALVATAQHFSQILEGAPPAIDEVMASIQRDSRHTDLKVVTRSEGVARKFADWSLAYAGRGSYVAARIEPLLEGVALDEGKSLSNLILRFTLAD